MGGPPLDNMAEFLFYMAIAMLVLSFAALVADTISDKRDKD